jgi:hypothetical protein
MTFWDVQVYVLVAENLQVDVLASMGVCGERPKQGPGHGSMAGPGVVHTLVGISSIRRSVVGSLYPRKITLPLKITSHFLLSKTTLHPALHKGQIPIRDAIVKDGAM